MKVDFCRRFCLASKEKYGKIYVEMNTFSKEGELVEVVSIQHGNYLAEVNLRRGGNCIRLRQMECGAKLLREPYGEEPDNPYLYGMPILFPVNRIAGGKMVFDGREYCFPINEEATGCHLHGSLHEMPFALLEREEHRLLCEYRAREGEYPGIPQAFTIQMEYCLGENGLTQRVLVRNDSQVAMPLMLGFHTTFNSDFMQQGNRNAVTALVRSKQEFERDQHFLPTGHCPVADQVTKDLMEGSFCPFGEKISRHYRSAEESTMVLYDSSADWSLIYQNDEKYRFRLIYNGDANEYICMEPQTCLVDCLHSTMPWEDSGFLPLAPKEELQFWSKISLERGDHR